MSDSHAPAASPTPADPHAAPHHDHAHDVAKHIRGYLMVGTLLIVFTAITVGLSYVDFDHMIGGHGWNIIIAMIVATFKAGLVAAIFMHLKGEKWTIWKFLLFTAFFCAGLFFLTLLHWVDPIYGTQHAQRF